VCIYIYIYPRARYTYGGRPRARLSRFSTTVARGNVGADFIYFVSFGSRRINDGRYFVRFFVRIFLHGGPSRHVCPSAPNSTFCINVYFPFSRASLSFWYLHATCPSTVLGRGKKVRVGVVPKARVRLSGTSVVVCRSTVSNESTNGLFSLRKRTTKIIPRYRKIVDIYTFIRIKLVVIFVPTKLRQRFRRP